MLNQLSNEMIGLQSPAQKRAAQTQQTIQNPSNMQSVFSPQGLQGALARGTNVYLGGLPNAPGAGRPPNPTPNFGDMSNPAMQAALQRQIQGRQAETDAREARMNRPGGR